jgi:hypothetical protein
MSGIRKEGRIMKRTDRSVRGNQLLADRPGRTHTAGLDRSRERQAAKKQMGKAQEEFRDDQTERAEGTVKEADPVKVETIQG